MDAAARRAALARTELFRSFSAAELDAVLAHATTRRAARGDVILRRGDANASMVVVMSGRVRVGLSSEDGKEATLSILGSGEVVGDMSLLDGEPCSADVTAQEDCALLVIDRGEFLRLLRANSELSLHLITVLTRRLRRLNTTFEDMALLDLPTRLGRVLGRLASQYGVPVRTGTRIEVRLSQKDLGTLVGASREKVNKQLRQWEADRVVGKDAGRIVVMNAGALPSLE